jgi:uncharacterized protein (TIGR03437 family)
MLFGTSGGAMRGIAEDGKLAGSPMELNLPVVATIGGIPARVTYAGAAPGLITGVLQVNVTVPDNAPAGDAVPISISVGGTSCQRGVTLALK